MPCTDCRPLRLVLCGFSIASAGVGTLISIPQLIGATVGAPGALDTVVVLQNIAINLGAVGIFSFLFSRDWQVGFQVTKVLLIRYRLIIVFRVVNACILLRG